MLTNGGFIANPPPSHNRQSLSRLARPTYAHNNFTNPPLVNIFLTTPNALFTAATKNFLFSLEVALLFTFLLLKRLSLNLSIPFYVSNKEFVFFFSFPPFPLVRGGHSVSSFSTSFCPQFCINLYKLRICINLAKKFYAGCPSCRNPPHLSGLGTGIKRHRNVPPMAGLIRLLFENFLIFFLIG